ERRTFQRRRGFDASTRIRIAPGIRFSLDGVLIAHPAARGVDQALRQVDAQPREGSAVDEPAAGCEQPPGEAHEQLVEVRLPDPGDLELRILPAPRQAHREAELWRAVRPPALR